MKIKCPSCKHLYNYSKADIGRDIDCPCGEEFKIPETCAVRDLWIYTCDCKECAMNQFSLGCLGFIGLIIGMVLAYPLFEIIAMRIIFNHPADISTNQDKYTVMFFIGIVTLVMSIFYCYKSKKIGECRNKEDWKRK